MVVGIDVAKAELVAGDQRRPETPPGRATAGRDRSRVEGAAPAASAVHHLGCRKRPQIAVVAVARELVGFLWAVMQEVPAST